MMLRIAAYIRPGALVHPTGVGKHQLNMIRELARLPDVRVTLMAPRGDLPGGQLPEAGDLDPLPRVSLPYTARTLERLWTFLGAPGVDRWAPEADWVYAPFEAWIPSRRARRAATVHCVNWFERDLPWHRDPSTRRYRWRLRPLMRKLLRRADLTATVSGFLKSRLVSLFQASADRVEVVGNGVEAVFFDAASQRGFDRSDGAPPYAMVVGSLRERKGADVVFAAARELQRLMPGMAIRVASGQTSPPVYRDEAARHPNIELLPYLDAPALAPRLRGAVALLFPSRYETFGIPAAEAMACGTPPVVSRFAALPEVVGDAGTIVDVDRPEEVAGALVRLARDPAYRALCAERGRRRAEAFRWKACAERLVDAMKRRTA